MTLDVTSLSFPSSFSLFFFSLFSFSFFMSFTCGRDEEVWPGITAFGCHGSGVSGVRSCDIFLVWFEKESQAARGGTMK